MAFARAAIDRMIVPTYTPWLAQRLASRCPAETRIVVAARQVGGDSQVHGPPGLKI